MTTNFPSIKYKGDQVAAKALKREANRQLDILREEMSIQGLEQSSRNLTWSDGSYIRCSQSLGTSKVEVFVPPQEVVEEEQPTVKKPPKGKLYFIFMASETVGDAEDKKSGYVLWDIAENCPVEGFDRDNIFNVEEMEDLWDDYIDGTVTEGYFLAHYRLGLDGWILDNNVLVADSEDLLDADYLDSVLTELYLQYGNWFHGMIDLTNNQNDPFYFTTWKKYKENSYGGFEWTPEVSYPPILEEIFNCYGEKYKHILHNIGDNYSNNTQTDRYEIPVLIKGVYDFGGYYNWNTAQKALASAKCLDSRVFRFTPEKGDNVIFPIKVSLNSDWVTIKSSFVADYGCDMDKTLYTTKSKSTVTVSDFITPIGTINGYNGDTFTPFGWVFSGHYVDHILGGVTVRDCTGIPPGDECPITCWSPGYWSLQGHLKDFKSRYTFITDSAKYYKSFYHLYLYTKARNVSKRCSDYIQFTPWQGMEFDDDALLQLLEGDNGDCNPTNNYNSYDADCRFFTDLFDTWDDKDEFEVFIDLKQINSEYITSDHIENYANNPTLAAEIKNFLLAFNTPKQETLDSYLGYFNTSSLILYRILDDSEDVTDGVIDIDFEDIRWNIQKGAKK